MEITKMILTNKSANPEKSLIKLKYISMHWTANTNKGANALANRNYFNTFRKGNNTSAHYVVDDKSIIQCLEDLHVGYHVAAKSYTTFGEGIKEGTKNSPNMYCLGIEMCVNSDGDFNKMYRNTVELVALLLKKHNLTTENITTHNKITGKNCPNFMLTDIELNKFKKEVNSLINPTIKYTTLRLNSKSDDVKTLQQKLKNLGYNVNPDGDFGKITDTILKQYQKSKGLIADGICGMNTWLSFEVVKPVIEVPKPIEVIPVKEEELININKSSHKYYKIATTHIVEIDPLDLKISVQDKPANTINLSNFVTSGFQMEQADKTSLPLYPNSDANIQNGKYKCYPVGILVSEGKVIQNRQPHNKPSGTLIVYKNGKVECKPVLNILTETDYKNIWFAVSGCTILSKIRMVEEGFVGRFADIGRLTDRPVIGYNPITNKIIIAVRPLSNIARGMQTLKNLGCTIGIALDAGGSTILRVDGNTYKNTTRRLFSVITW